MNIIVVGCGRVGAELANRLSQNGHKVSVIDQDPEAFHNLPADFSGRTIEGEALNKNVLYRAGIESAQGLAVVTNSDTINAVVAHVAKAIYKIQNVVVRNYDVNYRPLHEAFNHQIINSSSWGAQRIEELLLENGLRAIFSAGNGEVEIYEFKIPTLWHGRTIGELFAGKECIPVSLARAGKAIIPQPGTELAENDIILVSATFEGIHNLRDQLHGSQEH